MPSFPPSTHCLITGASDPKSVGYACADALLEAGADAVTITGRNQSKIDAAVASLTAKHKHNKKTICGLVSDLTKPESMPATVDQAAAAMGNDIPITVLVTSGGNGFSEWLGLDAQDPASYRLLQEVAVISPMKLTHAVVAKAKTNDKTQSPISIVMVSSQAANTAWPDTAPYNVTKAAQNCLVQQLAFQYRDDNVRVNAVLPACIHTGALDVMAAKKNVPLPEYAALRAASHPLNKNGTPHDVAQAVLYLASPLSSAFTTGTLLPVDGGMSISSWWNKPRMLAEFQGNAKLDAK